MIKLLEAIKAKFDATTALTSIFTKMWIGQAPDKEPLPVFVLTMISNTVDVNMKYTGGTPYVERVVIQFDTYTATAQQGLTAHDAIADAFHQAVLAVTTDVALASLCTSGAVAMREDERTWKVFSVYEMTVQRQGTN